MKKQRIATGLFVIIGSILGMIYAYYHPNINKNEAILIASPLLIGAIYFRMIMNPNIK